LPLTDVGGGFLFREGLHHLDCAEAITVVDFARDDEEKAAKLPKLMSSYRNIFPSITPEQFFFSGAVHWVRDNMTEWLYDSQGNPVAFRALGVIVSRSGRFIGTIRDYIPSRQDIWHYSYKCEIFQGNR
jgi:hypothetical protein